MCWAREEAISGVQSDDLRRRIRVDSRMLERVQAGLDEGTPHTFASATRRYRYLDKVGDQHSIAQCACVSRELSFPISQGDPGGTRKGQADTASPILVILPPPELRPQAGNPRQIVRGRGVTDV